LQAFKEATIPSILVRRVVEALLKIGYHVVPLLDKWTQVHGLVGCIWVLSCYAIGTLRTGLACLIGCRVAPVSRLADTQIAAVGSLMKSGQMERNIATIAGYTEP
jgi:hypothetical protein